MTLDQSRPQRSAAKRDLIAQRLRQRAGAAPAAVIPQLPQGAEPPLSFAQERLWFLEQAVTGGTGAYIVSFLLRPRGPVHERALRSALAFVSARHQSLRSRIGATRDGLPRLGICADAAVPLRILEARSEQEIDAALEAEANRAFEDLSGPLVRALLVRGPQERSFVLVCAHHIVVDGWSTDILARELAAVYEDLAAEREVRALPQLPVQYGDYAAWQRERLSGELMESELAYWRTALAGVPPLDLPTDRPRPARQTFDGSSVAFRFDREVTDALFALGARHGATVYMTLLALYQVALHRTTTGGQTDFAVGSPMAGRTRPEFEPVVGMFANVLTLRARVRPQDCFLTVLEHAGRTSAEALAHQEAPFEKIVADLGIARDVSRSPLFQATLALQNFAGPAPGTRAPGARRQAEPEPAGAPEGPALGPAGGGASPKSTRFDLEWFAVESPDGLDSVLIYNTALFTRATILGFVRVLATLAEAIVAEPEKPVGELDVLCAEDSRRVTVEWPEGARVEVAPATLHGLIAAQAARTPQAVAVADEQGTLTYAQLDAAAARLAGLLREHGAGRGSLVAVCAQRSVRLPVALLAVLKAGAAYLPLDPAYPAARLAYMIEDSGAAIVLAEPGLLPDSCLERPGPTVLELGPGVLADQGTQTAPDDDAGPDDAAYVIYTSGSTGRPKGVVNTHRGIVNRLDWMQRAYRLTAQDVVLQKTPSSFDVSVWEFFWPLLAGARLVLAIPEGHRDPAYLAGLIRSAGITTAHFVPSMLGMFLAEPSAAGCTSLRRIVCSGEALPVHTALEALRVLPNARVFNLYGPTEAAIDVTAHECRAEELAELARVPIGAPIQNLSTYILDAAGRPAPPGVAGELHLGGAGLARCYHGRPALTAQRFIPNPYGPPGSRLYRTGDLARWRADGTIDILGRLDHQVKLRGQRIELGEVEESLRALPRVRDAVVLLREDAPGDQRLAAYVVGQDLPPEAELREALRSALPEYMVPSSVTVLEALPLSANGKLDRAALPAPAAPARATGPSADPATDDERTVAGIWREVLGVERVGREDDFFELGGHSMLAVQVIAKLRAATGSGGVAVLDLFTHRTLQAFAALLGTAGEPGGRALLAELTPRRSPGAPAPALSYVCVPYGGGSAVVYQPLADALPAGHALYSVAVPGSDVGLDEDSQPIGEVAKACVAEILEKVKGPLVLYGHCGLGAAVTVAICQLLAEAGRPVEAVYFGAIFPFSRPRGVWRRFAELQQRVDRLRSDQRTANWLTSMGIGLDEFEPDQARRLVRNVRADSVSAADYFTELFDRGPLRLHAPVVTVVGERDPMTEFSRERYREWAFLTETSVGLVQLDEAGHYFLKYRAEELAQILTGVHPAVAGGQTGPLRAPARGPEAGWRIEEAGPADEEEAALPIPRQRSSRDVPAAAPRRAAGTPRPPARPGIGRFLAVAAGQLVSMVGSALVQWALPLYVLVHSGSVTQYALLTVTALVPTVLASPLAGAVVDRMDRKRVMLAGDCASGLIQAVLGLLLWSGDFRTWQIYPIIAAMAVCGTFQRLAYISSIAQLVPKRFLGNAVGIAQFAGGTAQLLVPLVAAGLLAAIGLDGLVTLNVISFAFAVAVTAAIRFPAALGWRREEGLVAEIKHGWEYSWRRPGLRSMLIFSAFINVFMAVPLMMMSPMVLAFGTLSDVARISFVSAVGAVLAALIQSVWGGPKRRRMRAALLLTAALGGSAVVTGAHQSLPVIGLGVLGLTVTLTLLNGVYQAMIQVKTPQRFHGRVFALITMISWSTLPIGYGLTGPLLVRLFGPLMAHGGALSGSVGRVIGAGPGRGVALAEIAAGAVIALAALAALAAPRLARADELMPDAAPDDEIGARERTARAARTAPAATATIHTEEV